jgi:hypothetical protein|tara:strand:- start:1131 stop:2132 length:1002 start_codon:yes stop_codon:yes gene_type:complete
VSEVSIPPYVPHPRLTRGHVMTLFTWGRPRWFPNLPRPVDRYFQVAPDARVRAACHWQADRRAHPTLIALHGLEGSSDAHYMRGLADKAFAAGFNVVRLNQRNCGNTEHLSSGLYHSGLTADPAAVVRELVSVDGLEAIAVTGYSLGGNLALKLAGDLGPDCPPALRAVCAISPTVDLALCVDALERRQNLLYQWNFVRQLKGRIRRKARAFPGRFALDGLSRVRTVREFDEAFTAPYHGFRDAADYYHRTSALRVVDRIRIPALVISSADDPFVPISQFGAPAWPSNPNVTVMTTPHGGHCGFISVGRPGDDGYWAEHAALRFVEAVLQPPA